jgi:hypothetical protein
MLIFFLAGLEKHPLWALLSKRESEIIMHLGKVRIITNRLLLIHKVVARDRGLSKP